MDKAGAVEAVFLDLQKAFDTVNIMLFYINYSILIFWQNL